MWVRGGIYGTACSYKTQAFIVFEDRKHLLVYDIEVHVADDNPEILDLPSLLGRDILNYRRMSYSPRKDELTFFPIEAHKIIQIDPEKKHPRPHFGKLPD